MDKPRILAFAGTTRREAYNKKLIAVAAQAARDAGGEVTLIDLVDFPMPLYDGDLEAEHGIPEHGRRLKALMKEHQAFLISTGEYNSSVTGVLKNAIDWASRQEGDEPALAAYRGKVAGLVSTTPGRLGGLRALYAVRSILGNINVLVIPEQQAVPGADQAFDEGGALSDSRTRDGVARVARRLVAVTRALAE